MPRYFFNLDSLPDPVDEVGTVLTGPEQARSAAVIYAGEMLRDIDGDFWSAPEWWLRVTQEQGATVCVLTVRGTTGEP